MFSLIEASTNSFRDLKSFQQSPYLFFDQVKPSDSKEIKRLRLGLKTFYFCYHPDHAKHILHDNKENYPKSSLVLKKILPLSGPTGLIQLSDEEAKIVRQAAGMLMHPDKAIRLSKYVERFVGEGFDQFDLAAARGEIVDLKPFLTLLVLRTAGIFILDQDIQRNAEKLNHAFVELNRMAGESLRSVFSSPFSPKRSRYLKIIHDELDRIIEERLSHGDTSLLHELNKKDLPRTFLRDQVKAFMFAGYDTTASSLIFAVDCIARDLASQEKIFDEGHLPYRSARYTEASYKESLRLYPSAYFLPRQAARDDFISGQKIKRGSQVFISIKHIQRCAEVYDDPDQFRPQRFLDAPTHSHSFIPFGAGPRVCIGAPLAMMEATVVLQKLCQRYVLSPVNPAPPEIEGLITAHTKSPLLLKLRRRAAC